MTTDSKQEQLEAFTLDCLLPKVREAIIHSLRSGVPGGTGFAVVIGKAKLKVLVSLEGEFDLSNLKLEGGDRGHLN